MSLRLLDNIVVGKEEKVIDFDAVKIAYTPGRTITEELVSAEKQ